LEEEKEKTKKKMKKKKKKRKKWRRKLNLILRIRAKPNHEKLKRSVTLNVLSNWLSHLT